MTPARKSRGDHRSPTLKLTVTCQDSAGPTPDSRRCSVTRLERGSKQPTLPRPEVPGRARADRQYRHGVARNLGRPPCLEGSQELEATLRSCSPARGTTDPGRGVDGLIGGHQHNASAGRSSSIRLCSWLRLGGSEHERARCWHETATGARAGRGRTVACDHQPGGDLRRDQPDRRAR